MDLSLTPAQEALRETARRFVLDVLQHLEQEFERGGGRLPPEQARDVRRAAIQAGLAGGELPIEAGGKGWSVLEQVLVHEQTARRPAGYGASFPALTRCSPTPNCASAQ